MAAGAAVWAAAAGPQVRRGARPDQALRSGHSDEPAHAPRAPGRAADPQAEFPDLVAREVLRFLGEVVAGQGRPRLRHRRMEPGHRCHTVGSRSRSDGMDRTFTPPEGAPRPGMPPPGG
jgi:hypothetical protein